MRDTAIIIPCYNEESRLLPGEFIDYARQHKAIHFIFVNDCSTDATARVIDTLCNRLPGQCTALHLPHNLGKAGAVRSGFQDAFTKKYGAIGFWDADLATPLNEIDHFVALLGDVPDCQMVVGARVRLLGRRIERLASRHYLGRIFATLASFTLGLTIYDTQCGAKLFANTEKLRRVFAEPFTVNWIFDVEILARFILLTQEEGERPLAEIAYEYTLRQWLDVPGSRLKARDFWVAIFEMVKIWNILRGPGMQRYYAGLKK
jgi:glycosyltransferase involved in cell wall biosynthesis